MLDNRKGWKETKMNSIQKKKKPEFKRRQFLLKKLKNKWRKPKGKHNKLRYGKAGHHNKPKIGYKNQVQFQNLFQSKFEFIKVNNLKDLEKTRENIILSKKLGTNKKLKIIEKALEMKLRILNLKDPQEFIKKVKEKLEKKVDKNKKDIKEEKQAEKKKEETKEEKEKKEKELKKKVLEGKKQR